MVEVLHVLYAATIMDLSSYIIVGWTCDLDIVADLVFMYEDVMNVCDDKLQRLLMQHYDF